MAERFSEINEKIAEFIKEQHIYFVATAAPEGRVNLSPKGMDTLRIMGPNRLAWLNLTGSGNETAAHLLESNRMTVMLCSFKGAPNILRLYGTAKEVQADDPGWGELIALFPEIPGARQIFDMKVDLVQTSCGYAVPEYEYVGDRRILTVWSEKKGEKGIRNYWKENNQVSLDGKPTGIRGVDS